MTEPTLRRLLHHLVAASLASPLALAAGCGGSGLPDPAPFALPACATGGVLAVTGLMPASPVDYLELRQRDLNGMAQVVAQTGTPCKTATDVGACTAALAALPTTPGFHSCVDHDCGHALATTAGDAVTAYNDPAAVQRLLGTIDTAQEAALTAYAAGYDLSCTEKATGGIRSAPDGNGYEVLASKLTRDCAPIETTGFLLKVDKSGNVTVQSSAVLSSSPACIGRRPDGLRAPGGCAATGPVGAFLAEAAHLEAASVTAFRRLRRELRAHGAPARLLRAASRAAGDEIRHARQTARLARRYDASAPSPRVNQGHLRPLEAIAIDNAVEGCVRETFGALVGLYQAGAARDPFIARAMTGIAADEVRHAALAWQVARWADRRLSPAARARVRAARLAAIATLRSEVERPVASELTTLAGLPPPAVARQLVEKLAASLWT